MRPQWTAVGAAVLLAAAGTAAADEPVAKSRVVSVGLFKNGLAVVRCEVTLDGPGSVRLDNAPEPVHGTYWVESPVPIETVVKTREVEGPPTTGADVNLQEELSGKKVTVHFKGGSVPAVSGTVAEPVKDEKPRPRRAGYYDEPSAAAPRFLVLQTAKGRAYLDAAEIAYVESEGQAEKVKQRKPVLVLTADKLDKPATVTVTYLARGLGWAPSYRVDVSDPKTLTVEQSAVVKNELRDLKDVEVSLISGFPSVQFANVTSPLSVRTSWAQFLQELGQRRGRLPDSAENVVSQQAVAPSGPLNLDLSALPSGEGVDVHYQSIGKRTLGEGEALSLTVAKAKGPYERIVEWLVPDTRNEYGVYRGDDEETDSAWDALRFKNPFEFPMTTGPALVTADGKFNGQRTAFWANAGEETVLPVTKALSVRTRSTEAEEAQKGADPERDVVWVGGRRFRRSNVAGELAVSNHRKEEVKLVIRRRFSGELVSADGDPKSSLREEGAWSVNRRNELLWTLTLKAGEEKKLTYRYRVLVSF
jgi:hypothetical protein